MKHWVTSRDGEGVVIARFANPPMNYFCADAAVELGELIAQWQAPDVRCVIIAGATSAQFITHYSVEELVAFASDRDAKDRIGTALSDGYHALLQSLQALPVPVIAAIGGDCMGGGLELALWCDLRVAQAGDFRIGLPEVLMGIMPGGSGTQTLTRMLGSAKALELVLTGRLLDPEEALRAGLVNAVAKDCVASALEVARRLSAFNPVALREIKAAICRGGALDLRDGLAAEARGFLAVADTEAAVAGMRAYVDVSPAARRRYLEERVALRYPD